MRIPDHAVLERAPVAQGRRCCTWCAARIADQHLRNQGSRGAPRPPAQVRRPGQSERADHRLRAPLRHLQARHAAVRRTWTGCGEIVCDPQRPVLFIFAGKAHPADQPGQDMLRRVIAKWRACRSSRASILLVEGYDLRLARAPGLRRGRLAQQPDLPAGSVRHFGHEGRVSTASSTCRCWTAGGAKATTARTAGPSSPPPTPSTTTGATQEEARTLYELLQDSLIPLYYNLGPMGFSPGWVQMAKRSIVTLLPRFNTARMLGEYVSKFYLPATQQWRRFSQDNFAGARELAAWKAKVRAAWNEVRMSRLDTPTRRIGFGDSLRFEIAVNLNGLSPEDVTVELLIGRPARNGQPKNAKRMVMEYSGRTAGSDYLYELDLTPELCGKIEYKFRVYPSHELLTHPFEMGMMVWLLSGNLAAGAIARRRAERANIAR
ncbi:MAG: hypothetical protein MZV65_44565 [Chromatiales bacterium]|nr:hypothetical protein [Chromatiales bacterium]